MRTNIGVREAQVQIQTSESRHTTINVEHLARITVEPSGSRGSGPLVLLRLYAQEPRGGRVGRTSIEMDRENTVELVRKLVLHFNIGPEEIRGD